MEWQTACAELKAACFCLGQSIKMFNKTTLHCPFDVRRASLLSASIWVSQTCLTQQLSPPTVSKQFRRFMNYSSLGTGYMATIQSTSGIPLHYAQAPESMLRQNINHPISYQNKTRDFINTTITQVKRKAKNLPNGLSHTIAS